MPYIDHIEKKVVMDVAQGADITIPYAFNAGALDRWVGVWVFSWHPNNFGTTNPPVPQDGEYGGVRLDIFRNSRSIDDPGSDLVWATFHTRNKFQVTFPLSGDVIIKNWNRPAHVIAYVIGLRGLSNFPGTWEIDSNNNGISTQVNAQCGLGPDSPFSLTGLAIRAGAKVQSVSGAATVLMEDEIEVALGSAMNTAIIQMPAPQTLSVVQFDGNASSAQLDMSPDAPNDPGEDVAPAEARIKGEAGIRRARGQAGALSVRGLIQRGAFGIIGQPVTASGRIKSREAGSAGPLRAGGRVSSSTAGVLGGTVVGQGAMRTTAHGLVDAPHGGGKLTTQATGELHDD